MSREHVIRGPGQHTTVNSSSTFNGSESLQDAAKRGKGAIVEGTIHALRNHTLNSSNLSPSSKYLAIVVDATSLRRRVFDAQGKEIEPNVKDEILVQKGYLTWEHKKNQDPDKLTGDQLLQMLNSGMPKGFPPINGIHPSPPLRFEFWAPYAEFQSMNLAPGTTVRLKTKGDTILVESLAKNEEKRGNYAGENVGDAWSAKIQAAKAVEKKPLPQDSKQGVEDDDEWK